MEVTIKETTMVTPCEDTPKTRLWVIEPQMSCFSLVIECLHLQVTRFKCGGVSVGVTFQHTLVDGTAALHFVNSWADTARGLCPTIAPVVDRSFLRARQPPTPKFRHVEFEPSPTLKTVSDPSVPRPSIVSIFKITSEQVKALKDKVNGHPGPGNTKFSTYSILTAHIWRCAIKARELAEDQEIKLTMPIDGRNRLRPPLPPGYFGNVIFFAAPEALAGEIQSESFIDTVKRIHEMLRRMDDEYLRSGIDLIETTADVNTVRRGAASMRCPNLSINSWIWLPIHDADFGWGRPVFMRPANIVHEGKVYILPSSTSDGSLTLATRLETAPMKRFGTLLYEL